MARQNEQAPENKNKSLLDKLPQILTNVFVVVNCLVMLGSTAIIYKVKVYDHRSAITEDSLRGELDEDRHSRENDIIRFTFDPFVINLDDKPRKLVHTTIELEMLNEDGYVEVVEKTPVARDEIVKIINSKHFTDIETIQGKLLLKSQIMTAMNKILQKGMVKDVYFGEFVVQ